MAGESAPPPPPSSAPPPALVVGVVRAKAEVIQYPKPSGEDEQRLLALMAPPVSGDDVDVTLFHLGRKAAADTSVRRATVAQKLEMDSPSVEVYAYEFNPDGESEGWEMLGDGLLVAMLQKDAIEVVDDVDQLEVAEIKPHFGLEFTEVEPLFVAVLQENSTALGFRFKNQEDEVHFLEALEGLHKMASINVANSVRRYEGPQLQCIAVSNASFAVAVCTQAQLVGPLEPLMKLALSAFERIPKQETLAAIMDAVKAAAAPVTPLEKDTVCKATLLHGSAELRFPALRIADLMSDYSLVYLARKYGARTMDLYNCVLTSQRLLFWTSGKASSRELCLSVMSACGLVDPLAGTCSRTAFPFATSIEMFVSSPSYVAGLSCEVCPAVEAGSWDVLCNVDTGEVTVSPKANFRESSAELDAALYNRASAAASIGSEEGVRAAFQRYTMRFVESALMRKTSDPGGVRELADSWRASMWRSGFLCGTWEEAEARFQKQLPPSVLEATRNIAFCQPLGEKELSAALSKLTAAKDKKADVVRLLKTYGCTDRIGLALMHQSKAVRNAAKTSMASLGLSRKDSGMGKFFLQLYDSQNQVQDE